MKVLSLFTGGGLGDYGLEKAGMQIVGQVEIEEYCQKVLALRWPDVPKWRDVREVHAAKFCPVSNTDGSRRPKHGPNKTDANTSPTGTNDASGSGSDDRREPLSEKDGCKGCIDVGRIDLISGGFPCQPFSTAGRRKGTADNRNLWPEMLRIIREVEPRWVLAENVPGLLSIDAGRVFGSILRDLAESGYDAEWDCIPASAVGAPHRRDRVWIVAYSKCDGRPSGQNRSGSQKAIPKESERPFDSFNSKGASKLPVAVSNVADANRVPAKHSKPARGKAGSIKREMPCGRGANRTHAAGARLEGNEPKIFARQQDGLLAECGWWKSEPDVGRVAHGVTSRVDRLKLLGNGQVVQVVEWIGKQIIKLQGGTPR